jgi:hypothetical protein
MGGLRGESEAPLGHDPGPPSWADRAATNAMEKSLLDPSRSALRPTNLLFILSDEHQRDIAGCYGNGIVRTPNIDKLAQGGARFTNAYTPCPICVPARSALATGRWVHQTRSWDNAHPYHGEVPSWHHRLGKAGHRVASIGKLHFRDEADDNGFTEEILPLHVLNGIGDLLGLIREPTPAPRGNMPTLARDAGPGESSYNAYDRAIADAACRWLEERGREAADGPRGAVREALGAVRLLRAPAFPAGRAGGVLVALPARRHALAAALRQGGEARAPRRAGAA